MEEQPTKQVTFSEDTLLERDHPQANFRRKRSPPPSDDGDNNNAGPSAGKRQRTEL